MTKNLLMAATLVALGTVAGCTSSSDGNSEPLVDPAANPVTPTPITPTPVNPEPEPVTPEPEPVTPEPEPVTPEPEPVTPEPEPVTPEPEPEPEPPAPTPIDPIGIISSVSVGNTQGRFFAGSPPQASGSVLLAPLSGDTEPTQIISGGSTQLPVTSDTPFRTVYVVSNDQGFFQVDLPEDIVNADAVITYSTVQLDGGQASVGVQVQNSNGDVSNQESIAVTTVVVGTGELQVSVSWDSPTDVDLYLLEPGGDLISWRDTSSPAGGVLDLDSNPGCSIDGVNNENITYENVTPPSGEYAVGVDYFSACDITGRTNYVVTVRSNGRVETFQGFLLPEDDNGEVTPITLFQFP